MRKIRAVELKENKKLTIIMIAIAVLMLIFSIVRIDITPQGIAIGFSSLASVISIIPLTIGTSAFMLMKTKKPAFGEFPCYIISVFIVMAFALLFFFKLLYGLEILGFALGILMIYPYIVAGLTVRGCIYNKVFAIGFAGLLIALSVIGIVVISVLIGFSFTYLVLPLMYTELLLNLMHFELKPLKKEKALISD
ncbi:MAG: hypothetical protein IJ346_00325 [Clostridia bacterium]|nr:hypothetical protein [Clostridia bacterium]